MQILEQEREAKNEERGTRKYRGTRARPCLFMYTCTAVVMCPLCPRSPFAKVGVDQLILIIAHCHTHNFCTHSIN